MISSTPSPHPTPLPRERRIFHGISSSSVYLRPFAHVRRANVVPIDLVHYLTQIASCCVIIFYRLIDCLYLCFSLYPLGILDCTCYTLICVPHVIVTRRVPHPLFILRNRYPFSPSCKCVPDMRISLSFFYSVPSRESRNDTPVASRLDSASPFPVPPRGGAVSNADNYTQCIKTNPF